MLLITYLSGWLVTSVVATFAAAKLRDRRPSGPLVIVALAILVGMLWPLVIIGLAQYGVIAVVAKRLRADDERPTHDAERELADAA